MALGLRYGQRKVNDRPPDREPSCDHPETPRRLAGHRLRRP
jgi:hypothetical protein